jgi:hypothetical protein
MTEDSAFLQHTKKCFQNALNAQRVAALVKTAETMGILDTSSETSKQSDIDEILGFLAALEKVKVPSGLYYKHIFMIVSDNRKRRLYYKCFISLNLSLG